MLVGIRVRRAIPIRWIVCAVGIIGIICVGIICAIRPSPAAGITYVTAIPATATDTARTSDASSGSDTAATSCAAATAGSATATTTTTRSHSDI
jgi:hypothetical protein